MARPDMPPLYPDAANALDVVAQRDGGTRLVCQRISFPLDRPNVWINTPDITDPLWHGSELRVEIRWRKAACQIRLCRTVVPNYGRINSMEGTWASPS